MLRVDIFMLSLSHILQELCPHSLVNLTMPLRQSSLCVPAPSRKRLALRETGSVMALAVTITLPVCAITRGQLLEVVWAQHPDILRVVAFNHEGPFAPPLERLAEGPAGHGAEKPHE